MVKALSRIDSVSSYLTRIEFEFWIQSLDAVHGEGQAAHVGQQRLLVQVRLQEPAQSTQVQLSTYLSHLKSYSKEIL